LSRTSCSKRILSVDSITKEWNTNLDEEEGIEVVADVNRESRL
jgi:hypothetical protein